MKAIFKGDAVRNTYTLDTGLEKVEGSDVSYFAREPKLVHHAEEVKDDVILEKDMSFNKIMLLDRAEEVTIEGMTFTYPTIESVNLDEDTVVLEFDGTVVVNDKDAEEKIETYNKLMEDYRKQHGWDASFDGCPCGSSSCEEDKCSEDKTKENKERKELEDDLDMFFKDLFGILGV